MAPSAQSSSISLVAPNIGRQGRPSPTLGPMRCPLAPERQAGVAESQRRCPTNIRGPHSPIAQERTRNPGRSYARALAIVLLSTAIAFGVQRYSRTADLAMIHLLGIVIVALRFDIKASLVSSLLSVALFDFLFVPPRLSLTWADSKNTFTFAGMLAVSAVVSVLMQRFRKQERVIREIVHEAQVEAETERTRSSLLSAVSHDLRTPLATIVTAGTTLLDRGEALDRSDSRELLTAMVFEAERLNHLIQNLLSVTRLESPTIELRRSPESVEEIIASAVGRVNAGPPQTHRIQVSLSQDLPWVLAEPALIEQVILNLLENAMRYSGPGSPVEVTASEEHGFVSIQVADRGPGILEADIDKVFEKFYRGQQVNRRDGGAGLGLTICRAIVRTHGGRIGVRNRQGGGTIVEFSLPVAGALEAPAIEVKAHA